MSKNLKEEEDYRVKTKKGKAKDGAVTTKEKKTNSQDKNAIIKAKDTVIKALD